MIDSKKMFQSLYAKRAISLCNSAAISMTYQHSSGTLFGQFPSAGGVAGEA